MPRKELTKEKGKILKINTNSLDPFILGNEPFEEVTNFTYLGKGGSDRDIKIRIGLGQLSRR